MKFFLLCLLATSALAQTLPPASTNRFAGRYEGILISASTNCPERVELHLFIFPDNYVEAHVRGFDLSEDISWGFGTNRLGGKFSVLFPDEGFVLTGVVANHKATGVLRPVIPGTSCRYTYTAWRKWKRGYDPEPATVEP